MRAVIFSDLHLHNYTQFSKIDDKFGLNTRMLDGIDVLTQILEYCVENKIKLCIFGGDLFHKGNLISPDILKCVIEVLWQFKEDEIVIWGIPGQHDYLYKDGSYNALSAFDNIINVPLYTGHSHFGLPDGMVLVPAINASTLEAQKEILLYSSTQKEKGKKNVLLGHFLVKEILEMGNFSMPTANLICFDDLPNFDLFLLGDYHEHIWFPDKRVLSIGATHQHQFAPNLTNRPQGGFIDMDLDTYEFKRILTKAPLFINIEANKAKNLDTYNFYRVFCSSEKEVEKIKKRNKGANMTFMIEDDGSKEASEVRLDIKLSLDPEEIIEKYVDYMGADKELIDMGKRYYRRSSNEIR